MVSYKQLSSKEELDETIASIRETQKSSTCKSSYKIQTGTQV